MNIVLLFCLMLFSLGYSLRSSSTSLRSNSRLMATVGGSLPKGINVDLVEVLYDDYY